MDLDSLQIKGKKVMLGTQPTSLTNGLLWFETDAIYSQPWEWETANSRWLSNPVLVPFSSEIVSNTFTWVFSIPFYNVSNPKIRALNASIFIANTGAAHNTTNQYQFRLDYLLGSGAYTTLYNFINNTGDNPSALGANGFRRINENINLDFPGNAWNIRFVATRIGTPPAIQMSGNVTIRYARP